VFFRSPPKDLASRPPLASSLQSLESSFLFLALGRYPHALVACASAIESAMKAAFAMGPEDRDNLARLIDQARSGYRGLQLFPKSELDDFRNTRNRIVHFGFSPQDDD
jgi:hypothetical protein